MTRARLLCCLLGSGLMAFAASPAPAQTLTYVDVQGGLGYSSNPRLQIGDRVGSGFGRISAYGYHGWRSERSETSFSAYLENTSYLRRNGDQQLFDLSARTQSQVSETVQIFGNIGFNGDFGGQLGSRFYGEPLATLPPDPAIPPSSEIVTDPDLAALNRRQYRIVGQGGATFVLSARDYLSTAFGAQRVFFSGSNDGLDYNFYNNSTAWQRRANERLTYGVRVVADYADYRGGRSVFSYGPQVTANTRLSEELTLNGAIGFVRTERDTGPGGSKDKSFDLAFDASLCRNLQYDRFCVTAARRRQSSVVGAAPTTSSLNGTFARQLSANDTLQLSAGFSRTDSVRDVGLGKQTYYLVGGSYDRKITDRLFAGVNVSGRKLSVAGPDPKSDVSGYVFIRNRFGSVR